MYNPLVAARACALASLLPISAMADFTIDLPDPGFAPEGIAASADGTLYVGSITQGRIVRVSPETGEVNEFVPSGANGLVSVIGVHVSADDQYVHACSSDPGASLLTGSTLPALVRFNRESGEAAGRFELPKGGVFCNDIAELPDGTILATDSFVPRIYALAPGADTLEIWYENQDLNADGFNFNGIAHDDGSVYILRYGAGALFRIPVTDTGSAGVAVEVKLPTTIEGADGLNALGNARFLIVEGGGLAQGSRGSLLTVSIDEAARVSVERIASDLNVPTTAAVIDNRVYLVEGQLDHLFDPDAGVADPYRLLVVALPESGL